MSLFHRLKARYNHRADRKYTKVIRRRQFNMTIAEEMITCVKLLAAIYKVPGYVITEHLLQVGSYHILQVSNDPQKRQKLEEHLVKVHLLGNELSDDESILRLGEEN
jgi:uncharacterized membrane-anchored protein YjiN (DUF445 family)